MIRRPELRQFAQGVTATYRLEPMDLGTTSYDVKNRLHHANGTGKEFIHDAIHHIHRESEGIPPMINKLRDLARVYASNARENKVSAGAIKELIHDEPIIKPFLVPHLLSGPIRGSGKDY